MDFMSIPRGNASGGGRPLQAGNDDWDRGDGEAPEL